MYSCRYELNVLISVTNQDLVKKIHKNLFAPLGISWLFPMTPGCTLGTMVGNAEQSPWIGGEVVQVGVLLEIVVIIGGFQRH